jgi:hypothetical protein
MKFSIIHPSRGRPHQSFKCSQLWYDHFSKENDFEYILSLDDDDPSKYKDFPIPNFKKIINKNRSLVDAVNKAANICDGDILIVVSDDFECPQNWDKSIIEAVMANDNFVLMINDGYKHLNIISLPILSRKFYEKYGYVYYEEYFSIYADADLYERAKMDDKIIEVRHLLFKHNHYTVKNGLPYDNTYARENSKEAWRIGDEVITRRRENGFKDRIIQNGEKNHRGDCS